MLRVFWRTAAAVAENWLNCRPLADRLLLHSVLLEALKKLSRLVLRFRLVHISKIPHIIIAYIYQDGVIQPIETTEKINYCHFYRASFALQVVGKGVLGSVGIVMSINEQEGIATVKFPSCEYRKACKASDILTVPISRLCTPRSEVRIPTSGYVQFLL